jgi:DNA-binding transcriptional MocR family regulator
MTDLDAVLDAAWAGKTPAELAHATLSAVISGQKPRMFSSAAAAEAEKQMKPGTEVIRMGGGMPDHGFLADAMPQLLGAAQDAWEKSAPSMFEYDFGTGIELLRGQVASYLSESRGVPVPSNEVMITTGNMGGIQLACQAYLGPGDVCVVESPLFSVSGRIAASTGADIEPVGMDAEGIGPRR